jgi:hypothetical protein
MALGLGPQTSPINLLHTTGHGAIAFLIQEHFELISDGADQVLAARHGIGAGMAVRHVTALQTISEIEIAGCGFTHR